MTDKSIETRTAKIWFGEDGILRIVLNPGAELTLADVEEHIAAARKITGGCKAPLLMDSCRIKSVSREARQFATREEAAKFISAQALLVGSPISRVIASFFLGLNKTPHPTKIFTSESEATEWLKGFVE